MEVTIWSQYAKNQKCAMKKGENSKKVPTMTIFAKYPKYAVKKVKTPKKCTTTIFAKNQKCAVKKI